MLLLLLSLATNGLPTEEDLKSFGGTSVKSVGGTNLAEKNECTLCLKLFQTLPLPPLSVYATLGRNSTFPRERSRVVVPH